MIGCTATLDGYTDDHTCQCTKQSRHPEPHKCACGTCWTWEGTKQ